MLFLHLIFNLHFCRKYSYSLTMMRTNGNIKAGPRNWWTFPTILSPSKNNAVPEKADPKTYKYNYGYKGDINLIAIYNRSNNTFNIPDKNSGTLWWNIAFPIMPRLVINTIGLVTIPLMTFNANLKLDLGGLSASATGRRQDSRSFPTSIRTKASGFKIASDIGAIRYR